MVRVSYPNPNPNPNLHHLYRVKEPLFAMLASQHNLHFMGALVAELREKIAADDI